MIQRFLCRFTVHIFVVTFQPGGYKGALPLKWRACLFLRFKAELRSESRSDNSETLCRP